MKGQDWYAGRSRIKSLAVFAGGDAEKRCLNPRAEQSPGRGPVTLTYSPGWPFLQEEKKRPVAYP
jgi:hypothetical protein